MDRVLGIDLGTTNSVVSIYDGGEARVLAHASNQRTTPSIVCYQEDGTVVVGEAARNLQVTQPANTIYSVKRFMGRRLNEVTSEEKLVPYRVIGRPEDYCQIQVHKQRVTPQQVSAALLKHLHQIAEDELKEPCSRVVITVPAYFNDAQRQATQDAGEIAGLTVERVINEPTAAALAYGIEAKGEQTLVVFDFGGGTFDLSAMRIGDGKFEVLGVHGNSHLGGDDFDQRIIDIVADDFKRSHGSDIRQDPMALQRLKQAAQQAKAELSFRQQTDLNIPFVSMSAAGPLHLNYTLTRERFESVCHDLFEQVRDACRTLLQESGLSKFAIHEVVMVGGSTRIPRIQHIAREEFETLDLNRTINPDEVVACGAAMLGAVIRGDLHNVHLMDVTSHGFGVENAAHQLETLVPKNTPIPTVVKRLFSTPRDNQRSVPINVLEGEQQAAADCRPLGIFKLGGIRKAPAGVPRIEVEFAIDASGVLKVSATDIDTGRRQDITVTGSYGLDDAAKEELEAELYRNDTRRQEVLANVDLRDHAERTLYNLENWLHYNAAMLPKSQTQKIQIQLQKLSKSIQGNSTGGMRSSLKKLDGLQTVFNTAA